MNYSTEDFNIDKIESTGGSPIKMKKKSSNNGRTISESDKEYLKKLSRSRVQNEMRMQDIIQK